MNCENYQKVRKVFHAALEFAPTERDEFLAAACRDDRRLQLEVESLLATYQTDFLEQPAVEEMADSLIGASPQLETGQTIGHYRILQQLGAGGMGEVYLAEDARLRRKIALKVLPAEIAGDKNRLRRFEQEAFAASALNHPNILTIYEFDADEEKHFLAAEFVEGETLRQRLRREPLSIDEALDVAIQMAAALSAAHEANIIHRDIKPENIMIRGDLLVKVLDFGLAKLADDKIKTIADAGTGAPEQQQVKTEPGVILGTIAYMSPEQARGEKTDARSDVWSLGCVLYEMTSGKMPFAGETTADRLAAIINDNPAPLSLLNENVPAQLEEIVNKSLEKDREERYQTVKDLLVDLRRLKKRLEFEAEKERSAAPEFVGKLAADKQTDEQRENKTHIVSAATTDSAAHHTASSAEYIVAETKRRRFLAFGVLALLLTLTGIGFAYYKFAGSAPRQFEAKKITRLTSSGRVNRAAVSPDGKFVAHVQQSDAGQSLWVRQITAAGETQIVAPAPVKIRAVNFSPDGNLIYYIVGETDFRGTLFQTTTLGGQPKKISENIYLANLGVNGVGFSPDGKQIAFVRLSPPPNDTSFLIVADRNGANERVLTERKRPDLLFGTPAWSPDGATIVCPFQNAEGMNAATIPVADAAAARLVLPTALNAVSQIVWLPDGKNLLMLAADDAETVLHQIYQVARATGARRRVNQDFNNYESIGLTADGQTLVAVRTEQTAHLWTMPLADAASRPKQITGGFEKYDGVNGLGWLADNKIFYESMPGGKQTIWRVDPDGENAKELAAGGGYGAASADGRYLAYQRSGARDGRLDQGLYLFDTTGATERRLTIGWDLWAEFAPDGKTINFIRWGEDEEMATLRSVSIEGGAPARLTKFLAITAAISPDGKQIAVARWNGAKTQIVIVGAAGGEPVKTFNLDFAIQDRFGKRAVQWTPDGRAINFIRDANGVSNLWQQPLDGGAPAQTTDFTSDLIFNFAFSPDGKQLVLSRGALNSDVVLIENQK